MITLTPDVSVTQSSERHFREGITMVFHKETWVAVWNRVIDFLFHSDIEYSEFQSCVMALIWGFWLAFNPVVAGITPFGDGIPATVQALGALFPSWIWSIWFVLLGTGHLIALSRHLWTARRFFSFAATCTWLYVATFLALTNYHLVAVPTTFFFAIGAAWGFWRLRSSNRRAC
jgi:hypothetical protein